MNLISHRQFSRPTIVLAALFVLVLALSILSACGSSTPGTPTPTVTLTPTATFPPTLTPTPLPLGSEQNPFVFGLVDENQDPQVGEAGSQLAQRIYETSGKMAIAQVYPDYQELLKGLADGNVHIAWMYPLTYLYASQRGLAEVALLTNHFGVYQYGSQFMANVESNFEPFFDPISGLSSADAPTALGQFRDLRPCWVDPQSASGYILPAGLLAANQIPVLPGVITQSHTSVVRALYIKGICDFGVSFSVSGDPRTGSSVQSDLPDAMNRVLIIWRSDAVIPNLSLTMLAGLSEADRQTLMTAFGDITRMDDGKDLLTRSAGGYQIEDMRVVADEIYDPLREMVRALNLDLSDMVGK